MSWQPPTPLSIFITLYTIKLLKSNNLLSIIIIKFKLKFITSVDIKLFKFGGSIVKELATVNLLIGFLWPCKEVGNHQLPYKSPWP
jgi:hypothetical protein